MKASRLHEKWRTRRRGFTLRDLAVTVTGLLIAFGLLVSLTGANRDLSKATVCASNLHQLFGGLVAYVNQYNSYPPHNPYPVYGPKPEVPTGAWDPSLGWILTYGLGLEPPARYSDGHFNWQNLDPEDLPSVVVCPAASPDLFDLSNPEIESSTALESTSFKYAAFYQTGGTCRAATRVVRLAPVGGGVTNWGGRNAPVPDPSFGTVTGHTADNSNGGIPYVYVRQKDPSSAPDDPAAGVESSCWIQAIHPAEVQQPGRVYYLADSRDYRPTPNGWPAAGTNNGWINGWGNKIFLGTRHDGYANVMYLDGRVTRDNQTHVPQWNMDYDSATQQARSSEWRCATFADTVQIANIQTQFHIMPVLMVKGWEYFFDADGVAAQTQ